MTSQPDQPASEAGDIPLLGGNEQDQLAAIAQSEFHNRRRRDSLIRYDLFAEPAWDMLLDLYILLKTPFSLLTKNENAY